MAARRMRAYRLSLTKFIVDYKMVIIIATCLLTGLLSGVFITSSQDVDQIIKQDLFDTDIKVNNVSAGLPMAEYYPASNNCNIIIPEDPVDSLFGTVNADDEYLKTIIVGHEKAHCMFYRMFEGGVMEQLKSRGESSTDGGQIYAKLLGENFADTYAIMTMLKHYDYSKEAMAAAQKWYTFRKDNRLSLVVYMDDIHYTDYSVSVVLKTIDRQKQVNEKEALLTMALEWSTTGALIHARQSRYGFGITGYGRIERIDKERLQSMLETQCGSRAPPFGSL